MATTKKNSTKKQTAEKTVEKKSKEKTTKVTKATDKKTKETPKKVEKKAAQSTKTETAPNKTQATTLPAKRRIVVGYNQLSPELIEMLNEKYPLGWRNSIMKVDKGAGNFFHAVMLDTEDVSYLIKVEVKIDSEITDDVEKDLFGGMASDDDFVGEDEAEDDFDKDDD